jgi:hypothetical protein
MDCVVSPVDHVFPEVAEEVSVTLLPEQNVVGPLAEIDGADGMAVTVTGTLVELAEQPASVTLTLYVPEVVTRMDVVEAPFDQLLPLAADEVSVTLPPAQNVVGPLALIVGVGGLGFTVTAIGAELAELQPPTVT